MNPDKLHVYFLPLMAPGHMIPMIDIARKFSGNGAKSTIITTSSNASQFSQTLQTDRQNGSDNDVAVIPFPSLEAGRPGCENLSSSTTLQMTLDFFRAMDLIQQPVEEILQEGNPDCLISDAIFWWSTAVACRRKIPRIVFNGTGFFPMSVFRSIREHRPHDNVASDEEEFVIPGLPDEVRLSRRQLSEELLKLEDDENPLVEIIKKIIPANEACYGIIVNSFLELEPAYAAYYRKVISNKAWHIGPVSLINKTDEDKSHREAMMKNNPSCLSWLDFKKPNSVLYICFGSMAIVQKEQLHEIAKALEHSGQDFIWVVGKKAKDEDGVDHLPEGFETRTEWRGLIIRGWAPQVQILDHPAIGGFLTHCGWNSLLEGVAAGVPMVTWPLSAEQFSNEKLVTEILGIGVPVGAEEWAKPTDERAAIECGKIERAVAQLMDEEEGERMRKKAKELGDLAKRAVQEGGSSDIDFKFLIEDIRLFHS